MAVLLVPILFAALFAMLLVASIVAVVLDARRRRVAIVLAYIEQAMRLNLPLPQFLGAVGLSETGGMGARLRRLATGLSHGQPLAYTLDWAVPDVSARERSVIAAAERIGRIEPALRHILARRNAIAPFDLREACIWAYPIALTALVLAIMSVMMAFVIPKFQEIFSDFDARLPDATVFLIKSSRHFAAPLADLTAIALLGVGLWMILLLSGARMDFIGDAADPILAIIPVVRRIKQDRALADAFAIMHEAIAAGGPLHDAANEAAQLRLPRFMRNRLRRFTQFLQQGATPGQAARRANLPALAAGMFAASTADDQMLHTTHFLANYYAARFSRAAAICRAAITPIVVLLLGILVGAAIYALFAPVVALIDSITFSHELSGGLM